MLLPSGKLEQNNYGTSHFLMGKSTINGPFSVAMLVYRRVYQLYLKPSTSAQKRRIMATNKKTDGRPGEGEMAKQIATLVPFFKARSGCLHVIMYILPFIMTHFNTFIKTTILMIQMPQKSS